LISSGPQECNKLLETDNSSEPVHHQNGTKQGSSANDAEHLSALILSKFSAKIADNKRLHAICILL